jgi:hypothetical protein
MALHVCFYVIQGRVPQTSEKISQINGISHKKNKQLIVHKLRQPQLIKELLSF